MTQRERRSRRRNYPRRRSKRKLKRKSKRRKKKLRKRKRRGRKRKKGNSKNWKPSWNSKTNRQSLLWPPKNWFSMKKFKLTQNPKYSLKSNMFRNPSLKILSTKTIKKKKE